MPDPTYVVPPGFEPVLNYKDGKEPGVPISGLAKLTPTGSRRPLEFNIENGAPTLPLKRYGELWHEGWDIPTRYAIDRDGGCWMDNAHGHELERVTREQLINRADGEAAKDTLRTALGIELPMPGWAQIATREGWTPPSGWTWKKS